MICKYCSRNPTLAGKRTLYQGCAVLNVKISQRTQTVNNMQLVESVMASSKDPEESAIAKGFQTQNKKNESAERCEISVKMNTAYYCNCNYD